MCVHTYDYIHNYIQYTHIYNLLHTRCTDASVEKDAPMELRVQSGPLRAHTASSLTPLLLSTVGGYRTRVTAGTTLSDRQAPRAHGSLAPSPPRSVCGDM